MNQVGISRPSPIPPGLNLKKSCKNATEKLGAESLLARIQEQFSFPNSSAVTYRKCRVLTRKIEWNPTKREKNQEATGSYLQAGDQRGIIRWTRSKRQAQIREEVWRKRTEITDKQGYGTATAMVLCFSAPVSLHFQKHPTLYYFQHLISFLRNKNTRPFLIIYFSQILFIEIVGLVEYFRFGIFGALSLFIWSTQL